MKKKKIMNFLDICDLIFSWYKYIMCQFSNGTYGVAVRYSTQKFDHISTQFLRPLLLEKKTALFMLSKKWIHCWVCKESITAHSGETLLTYFRIAHHLVIGGYPQIKHSVTLSAQHLTQMSQS